ncbi:amidase [Klebsiella pneumoniae]|uniref:amidase n=1 Tax=Klebsiella pneumoniae TaxID=573 RepID=UPI001BA9DAFB|nr:amidase [Klebsiella pneumoniae]MBQ5265206.1 amidase [Klebsiella pneumoniae]
MNAFMPGPRLLLPATAAGVLNGFQFAVKDLIDVADSVTGGGNPDWQRTHSPATEHAPCVTALLEAGATFAGKTISDELAYSLEGINGHYGTPCNPRWPHALPGGSSSGSASAVAAGEVDFALGTDTGGSVRIPAAFCGLWGLRTTHGSVSLKGVLPFAPCFDTVGWFTREGALLTQITDVLLPALPDAASSRHKTPLLFAEAFATRAAKEPDDEQALRDYTLRHGPVDSLNVFAGQADRWLACYQHLQDSAIQEALGDWLQQTHPRFAPDIAARFARLNNLDPSQTAGYLTQQQQWQHELTTLLANHWLIMPTTPRALLPVKSDNTTVQTFYQQALTLNAVAGLAGLPQVTIPLENGADRPLAISVIGAQGSDRQLIAWARNFFA